MSKNKNPTSSHRQQRRDRRLRIRSVRRNPPDFRKLAGALIELAEAQAEADAAAEHARKQAARKRKAERQEREDNTRPKDNRPSGKASQPDPSSVASAEGDAELLYDRRNEGQDRQAGGQA